MSGEIGQRHAGDLGGRLFDPGVGARVTIAVSKDVAHFPSTQHLVWMLVNLLARQPAEVREIVLDLPANTPLAIDASPLVDARDRLVEAFVAAARRINPSVFDSCGDPRTNVFVRVGPGRMLEADLAIAVSADCWSGYVGSTAATVLTNSTNPIGAYIGASLATAEIFKFIRKVQLEEAEFPHSLWFNAFTLELSEAATESPAAWEKTSLPTTTLAGVGAVGSAFLQTLYTFPGCRGSMSVVDGDVKGVTETNLNRYVLFDLRHVPELHMKAATVATFFKVHAVQLSPFDEAWQTACEKGILPVDGFVISAVDRNSARHAIQDSMPRKILGASTNELKLQVNLYDVFDPASVCLKCRNRVEVEGIPDDIIVERLRKLSKEDLLAAAVKMGVPLADVKLYMEDPKVHCAKVSGSSLQKFAESSDEGEWSVGFVSFLAGVLLCAEYLKQIHGSNIRMVTTKNQFMFQFWRPARRRANHLTCVPPEAGCLCRSAFYQRAILSNTSGK